MTFEKKREKIKKEDKLKLKKVEKLINVIDKIYPSTWELMWRSFLRGIFVGLGTTIGASLVIGGIAYTISQLKSVPVIKQIIIDTNVEEMFPDDE